MGEATGIACNVLNYFGFLCSNTLGTSQSDADFFNFVIQIFFLLIGGPLLIIESFFMVRSSLESGNDGHRMIINLLKYNYEGVKFILPIVIFISIKMLEIITSVSIQLLKAILPASWIAFLGI